MVGSGQAKPTASKRDPTAGESDAHVLTTTTVCDKSDRHLGADDDGNKAFEQMEGGGGDSSCRPVVLEGDASTENVPAIAATTKSRIATESGGGATLTAAAAKPKQTPKTPTTNISKPTASRLSFKQRMEKVPAIRIEAEISTSDSKADDAPSSIKGSTSRSLRDDAASSAGSLVQSGLKQPKSSLSSAETDTLQVLGGGTGMTDEDAAKAAMKAPAETIAAETVAPSEADDGDKSGNPVVKGRPAAAARLSLKQRMSGSSSVQPKAQRSKSAADPPISTSVDENSDSRSVQPATGDVATVAEKGLAGATNLHECEVSTPPPVVAALQTAEVGGDASITSANVEGKPEPGVKEEPKAIDGKGEEGLETKAAAPVPVAAPAIGADSEATASSLETSPEPTPADQVVAGSRSNTDG